MSVILKIAEEHRQLERVNMEKLKEFSRIATEHNPEAFLAIKGVRTDYYDNFETAMIAVFAAVLGAAL